MVKNSHHLVVMLMSNSCFVIYVTVMIFMSNQPHVWGTSGALEDEAEAAHNLIWALPETVL